MKLDNYIPRAYKEDSRDYNLFVKLTEILMSSIECDINNMIEMLNPLATPSKYLSLLATRIGYSYDSDLDLIDPLINRTMMKYYSYLYSYRGSLQGVNILNTLISSVRDSEALINYDTSSKYIIILINSTNDSSFDQDNLTIYSILLELVRPIGYDIQILLGNIVSTDSEVDVIDSGVIYNRPSDIYIYDIEVSKSNKDSLEKISDDDVKFTKEGDTFGDTDTNDSEYEEGGLLVQSNVDLVGSDVQGLDEEGDE